MVLDGVKVLPVEHGLDSRDVSLMPLEQFVATVDTDQDAAVALASFARAHPELMLADLSRREAQRSRCAVGDPFPLRRGGQPYADDRADGNLLGAQMHL